MSPLRPYTRFRQVCVASLAFDQDVGTLTRILGKNPCHTSKLEQFGLENALFAVGGSFIEIVAPIKTQTAVHRFIHSTNGIGGYMAIFDCEDVARFRKNATESNIRIIADQHREKADLLQLSPKDTGITMLEFDHHDGSSNRLGSYEWAGSHWQKNLVRDVDIVEISMACADPKIKIANWCRLFEQPTSTERNFIELDHGTVQFELNSATGRDYFKSVTLKSRNKDLYVNRAREQGLEVQNNCFEFCGVKWIWT